MNKMPLLILSLAVVLLVDWGGVLWAANDCEPWNRPNPIMDYVPQELGTYDTMYPEYNRAVCTYCHRTETSDRHHYADDGDVCVNCHVLDPNEPTGVQVEHNCLALGCHQWPWDIPANGWHHNGEIAGTGNCIACHNPNLIEETTDFRDPQTDPPLVASPTPFSCENCHWSQLISSNHYLNDADQDPDSPGHPSTYDHYDRWWNPQGYYEYEMCLYTSEKTHHMEGMGYIANECWKCHGADPNTVQFDPFDPAYMRYCMRCHTVGTLHRIGPHVQKHPGWRPVGFHATAGQDCADADPTEYRTGDIDEAGHSLDDDQIGIYDNVWPDMDTSDNGLMYDMTYPDISNIPAYYWGQVPNSIRWFNTSPDPENPSPTAAENWASGHWSGPTGTLPDYYTANEQCRGCHGPDPNNVPDWMPELAQCEPVINYMYPTVGIRGCLVTLTGECLGEHTVDNGVLLWDGSGSLEPYPAGNGISVPIHTWNDTVIEFAIPCLSPNLSIGNYYVFIYYYDDNQVIHYTSARRFTVLDYPCITVDVSPTASSCATWLTISGCCWIGPARSVPPSVLDYYNHYHGRLTVVDFVSISGSYTAQYFRNWTDNSFEVAMSNLFEDQVDTCGDDPKYYGVDLGNYVRDDGTSVPSGHCSGHVCPAEVTIPACDSLAPGIHNIYVNNIYYGDEDASNSLTCGDTIFQIDKSDPIQWELTADPYIYKVVPSDIDCSYKDASGVHWSVLRIYGGNFGLDRGDGEVIIGPYGWWTTNPIGSYFAQPFVIWSDDLIKIGVVFPEAWEVYFPPAAAEGKTGVVWVRKNGQYTDPLPLYIRYCDIYR